MMKARLYVKGMKEPKDLTYSEGKAAEDMLKDVMVPPETPFVIEGVWSGRKADIKFVDWEREATYEDKKHIEISDIEYEEITAQLEKAEHLSVANGFGKLRTRDFWYDIKGVVRYECFDSPLGFRCLTPYVRNPSGYMIAQDLMEAYEKKRFVEGKKMEDYQGIASEEGF